MTENTCPNCKYTPLESGVKVCPNCGAALPGRKKTRPAQKKRASTRIEVEQKVGEVQAGGQVTGVQIGQISGEVVLGFTAQEVSELLDKISSQLQPKPFDGRCPYVGLDSFREEDAGRFFGRERLVDELTARIHSLRFLAVAGPSGSGKSSLVRAGLIPALKQGALDGSGRWLYASMNPGRAPLEALGKALSALSGSLQPLNDFRQSLESVPANLLKDWADILLGDDPKRRLVLVVDQFEELFTQLGEADAGLKLAFIQQMTQAAAQDQGRLIIILTLRSDFVSNCAAHPELNSLLNQGFFQVGPMAPDELVSAIARPALQAGLRIEPELVAQIVADMRQEPGALPLMQFALKDLFEHEQSKGGVMALTLDGYLERGGLHRALARYADDAFTRLNEEEQKLAESIFRGLVQPGRGTQDARRTALFGELTPAGADPAMVETIIHRLADARLITTDERPDTPEDDRTATLAHERLLEAWPWLRRLVDENREAIALQVEIEQDAQRWESSQRDESYLYTGARLATAQERLLEKKLSLSSAGDRFVAAAVALKQTREAAEREARDAEQRRELEAARQIAEEQKLRAEAEQRRASIQRRMLQIVGGLLVVAVALTIWALLAQINANNNFEEAARQAGTATSALGVSYLRGTQVAEQRQLAFSRQLAAQSLTELLQGDHAMALRLAAHAFRIADTPAARSALLTGLQENPRLVNIFDGHQDYVLDVAAQPGASLVVSAGCGGRDLSREKCLFGEVRLWDLHSGKPAGDPLGEHGNAVRMVRFSPDGKLLASVDDDGVINLWEMGTRTLAAGPLARLDGNPGFVGFSPDSSLLYARSQSGPMLAWEVPGGVQLSGDIFPGLPQDFKISSLHPGGLYLAGRDDRNIIQIWSRTPAPEPSMLQSSIDAFSQKESIGLLLGGPNLTPRLAISLGTDLIVYDALTGEPLTGTMTGHQAQVRAMAFSPDSQHLATGSLDRSLRIWNLKSWPVQEAANIAQQQVFQPEISYDPLLGHLDTVTSLDFAVEGRYLVSGSRDRTVRVWDWSAEDRLGELIHQADGELLGMRLSPDGETLTYGGCAIKEGEDCRKGLVSFLDIKSGELRTGEAHNNQVNVIAYHAGRRLMASGSWDGTIYIWDANAGEPVVGPIAAHSDFVTGLAFSPDGGQIASSSRDGSIKIWNTSEGTQTGDELRGHEERITTVAWSPQGDILASAGRDSQILLWDISVSPAVSRTLEGHLEQVNSVVFSLDGKLLASSSADDSVIVWDVAAGKLLLRLLGHSDRSTGLAFSPDGAVLASGSWDTTIRLWDTSSGQEIGRPLTGHGDDIGSLIFDRTGDYLYSSSRDGQIMRWEISPSLWLTRACQIAVHDLDAQEWQSLVGPGIEFAPACPP